MACKFFLSFFFIVFSFVHRPRTRRKGGKKSIWDAQLDARLLEIIEEEDANAKKDREANGANGAHTTQRNWKRIAQKLGGTFE